MDKKDIFFEVNATIKKLDRVDNESHTPAIAVEKTIEMSELVHAEGGDVITALTKICNKIWQTGEWPTPWTQSLVITLPKKGNLQQCQNY